MDLMPYEHGMRDIISMRNMRLEFQSITKIALESCLSSAILDVIETLVFTGIFLSVFRPFSKVFSR